VKDAAARVSQLRSLGFRVGIDDFGAGYAGLQTFSVLEPDYVKVDMSLVRNVQASTVQQRLVENAVVLCRDLQTSVIAEGVESPEERDTLGRLGCELMQGYLFGRPGSLARPSNRSPG
jgi:EAL domain-containing protein (putative c-di-GMP-specific phosphodiesterase class I)